jgi:hypothetical protein
MDDMQRRLYAADQAKRNEESRTKLSGKQTIPSGV